MSTTLKPLEADLLSAAFLPHPDALPAWRRWRDSIDWHGPIDAGAFALLPYVHANLRRLGADDPLIPRLRGIARQAWLANQLRIAELRQTLELWGRAGVDVLLLPPFGRWLVDPAALFSPSDSLAWAVRPAQAEVAVKAMGLAGWRIRGLRVPPRWLAGYVVGTRHLPLESPRNESAMLTWGLDWWFGERSQEVWHHSTQGLLGKVPARALAQTDAIEFCLRHPAPKPLAGQMADVLAIASQAGAIDWPRLSVNLERHPLSVERTELIEALGDPFLMAWGSPPRTQHWIQAGASPMPPAARPATLLGRLRQDWTTYRRAWGTAYTPGKALAQLPGYLMARWRLSEPWQLSRGIGGWLCWKGSDA